MTQKNPIYDIFRAHGGRVEFSKNSIVFSQEDDADCFYYLEKGTVRAYLLYPDGQEKTICYVDGGNLVGEEVMSPPYTRIVTVDATTDLVMYKMHRDVLRHLMDSNGEFREILTAMMMQKIQLLTKWIYYSRFSDPKQRIACFLADHGRTSEEVAFTQDRIAQVTGMTRSSVIQNMKKLEEMGFVRREYGKVRILDLPGLTQFFQGEDKV